MRILTFVLILLAYLSVNYYVFHRIWVAMPSVVWMRVLLVLVAIIVACSFFIAAGVGESLPITLTSILYHIGTAWLFILLYLVFIFAFQDIILLISKLFNFAPSKAIAQFSKENRVGMLFTIGFVSLLMLGGYFRYLWKDRIHLPIELSKQIGDSTSQRSLRVVAVSDLHLGYTIGAKELDKWVSLINNEKPDIILIAGDLIDNSLRPLLEGNHAEVLRKLEAPMGVYACMGNHEYMFNGDVQGNRHFFEAANIHLLRDDYIEIDSSFYVVGRDDKQNSKRKELSELVKDLDKTKPIILLDHQPYSLEVAEENGIDLQLSGHTHKGQVWPISMITSKLYEQDHGYLKKGDTHIYVSSGLGIWGGKFRIGTTSEYVVIDINKNS